MYFHVGATRSLGPVYAIGLLLYEAVGVNFQTGAAYQLEGHSGMWTSSRTRSTRGGAPWISDGAIGRPSRCPRSSWKRAIVTRRLTGNYDAFANADRSPSRARPQRSSGRPKHDKSYKCSPASGSFTSQGRDHRHHRDDQPHVHGNGNLLSENKYGVATLSPTRRQAT